MNCLEFRRSVGAEPRSAVPDIAQHAAQCPACARYREQMQQMDARIQRALAIDVNAPAVRPAPHRRALQWGLAASVMLAVAVGVFWLGFPRSTLASDIVAHVHHEAGALQLTGLVSAAKLEEVLSKSRIRLRHSVGAVSFANACPFRGHRVPHLIVQTSAGPVTVLALTEEQAVAAPTRFREDGFEGVILPAPRGVLAVLGQNAPVDEVASKVLAAVEYLTDG